MVNHQRKRLSFYGCAKCRAFSRQSPPINIGWSAFAYQCRISNYGTLNADKSNAVLICHALTGDAEPYFDEPNKDGWWQNFYGGWPRI